MINTNYYLFKWDRHYQLAIVHIANANSMLRNWKTKINLLIKIIYFFSVKWKLTACWDEKHWEKKVTQRNSSKLTAYIPNEYTFRRKKLVRSLIFEMKLAYYILWLVLAKLNHYDQSVKTIAHNTNAKHMLKNWGKKIKWWICNIFCEINVG